MSIKVTIIGLDALGQSIGLALKSAAPTMTIIAHDREHARAGEAVKVGAADSAEWNLLAAIDATDLVFLNEPIYHIKETLELLGRELRADAVITDTSSVKQPVLTWAEALPSTVHFVGSTPLVNAYQPHPQLFQKQRYAVLPLPKTPESAVRLVTNIIELMGAEPLFMEPSEHDTLMASVLHLPALMSAALLQLTTRSNSWREMAALAGPAYARMSALPASNPQSLATQLRYNREPLLHWLASVREELTALETLLTQNDEGIALEAHLVALLEAQARWREAEVENPEHQAYDAVMAEVKESGGMRRFLNFGWFNKKEEEKR